MRIIRKLLDKDYSYTVIIHILIKKYAISVFLRTLQRILAKMNCIKKNVIGSSPALIITAICLELNDTGRDLGHRALWKRLRKVY